MLIEAHNYNWLYENYCWCTPQDINDFQIFQNKDYQANPSDANIKNKTKQIKKRRRKNSMPEIEQNIENIIKNICENTFIDIEGRHNHENTGKKNIKRRSSNYIGVSKNGLHWQVLINHENNKKYIGTYSTEKEAAIAYDFYAIVLTQRRPKTNSELVNSMIASYNESKPNTYIFFTYLSSISIDLFLLLYKFQF